MRRGNEKEQSRVSGLIGTLNATETIVAKALLAGRSPGADLAHARGKTKAGREEQRDVSRIMASDRVRRVIAGVTGAIRPSDLRSFVMERLVAEAEDAAEGATRMKALEAIGRLPGVDLWTPQQDDAADVAASGADLAAVLSAMEARLSGEVQGEDGVAVLEGEAREVDAVQPEPEPWD